MDKTPEGIKANSKADMSSSDIALSHAVEDYRRTHPMTGSITIQRTKALRGVSYLEYGLKEALEWVKSINWERIETRYSYRDAQPCPFCNNVVTYSKVNPDNVLGKFTRKCAICDASGPRAHSISEATEAWNKGVPREFELNANKT